MTKMYAVLWSMLLNIGIDFAIAVAISFAVMDGRERTPLAVFLVYVAIVGLSFAMTARRAVFLTIWHFLNRERVASAVARTLRLADVPRDYAAVVDLPDYYRSVTADKDAPVSAKVALAEISGSVQGMSQMSILAGALQSARVDRGIFRYIE